MNYLSQKEHFEILRIIYENNNSFNILKKILYIFVLSEMALGESRNNRSWIQDERLSKQRKTKEYDENLQNMLLSINNDDLLIAKTVECGSKSYYKTECKLKGNCYLLFNHTFDPNAKYIKKYLNMNKDVDSPKFAYFRYDISKQNEEVEKLELCIPYPQKDISEYKIDLTGYIEPIRKELLSANRPVKDLLHMITEEETFNGNLQM